MLSAGDTVLVALSGGADSMALLHALSAVRDALGITLGAAHVHHGLRGAEADADADFVRGICVQYGIQLWEKRLSPPPHASEDWGRQARYAFFESLAQAQHAKIATAHTGSDNAETVLFRLARGSAVRGAAGIPPVRGCCIRPLLWAQRSEVLSFLAQNGVSYVTDSTNLTDAYARNRVRHSVLPLLEEVHAGASQNLARFAFEMTEVAAYLDAQAQALLSQAEVPSSHFLGTQAPAHILKNPSAPLLPPQAAAHVQRERQSPIPDTEQTVPAVSPFGRFYRAPLLTAAPVPVRRTALAWLIESSGVPQEKTRLVPQAEALLAAGHGRLALSRNISLFVSQGLLSLENGMRYADIPAFGDPSSAPPFPQSGTQDGPEDTNGWILPFAEGVFSLPNGYMLLVERRNCEEMIKSAKDAQNLLKFSADCDRIHDDAIFRTIRPGDRFRPVGRGVAKPLKKWYSERKVPLAARACLPVLAVRSTILWAAGFGCAEEAAVDAHTKTAVTICVRRTEGMT